MRKLLVLCSFWLCVATLGAQNAERKLYSVAFYNLENLFDTVHDAGKNDHEFLPDGSYQWTAKKYESKLQNLSKVLGSLSRDLVPEGPAFIGVAEVENSRVLEDLVKQPAISNYEFVHYEGPDRRGIDWGYGALDARLPDCGRATGGRACLRDSEPLALPWGKVTGACACSQAGKGLEGLSDA